MHDLNSLYIFVNVIERGGFSAASSHTGIPVATVSRRINELEKQMGLRLIERSTRYIRLTESGQIIYEFAKRGLEEFEAGFLALEDRENEIKGTLRISMPPTFTPWFELINDYQREFPNVDIDAFVSPRKVNLIEDGIDVALRIGSLVHQTAVAREIYRYRHIVVASPKYIVKYGQPNVPAELIKFPLGIWHKFHESVSWSLGGLDVEITAKVVVNDYIHLQFLALNDFIITELPPFFCRELINEGRLVEILPEYPMPEQTVSLVYPTRQQVSRVSRSYIDFCVANADKYLMR